jgi:hypothetical protein
MVDTRARGAVDVGVKPFSIAPVCMACLLYCSTSSEQLTMKGSQKGGQADQQVQPLTAVTTASIKAPRRDRPHLPPLAPQGLLELIPDM